MSACQRVTRCVRTATYKNDEAKWHESGPREQILWKTRKPVRDVTTPCLKMENSGKEAKKKKEQVTSGEEQKANKKYDGN